MGWKRAGHRREPLCSGLEEGERLPAAGGQLRAWPQHCGKGLGAQVGLGVALACDSHHQHGGSITIRLSQGRVLLLHYPAGRAIIITSMEAVSAFLPWKQDSSSSPLFPRLLPRASSPSQENHRDAQGIPRQHCPSCCHTHTQLYVLCL